MKRNYDKPDKWAFHWSFYSPYSKGLQALLPNRIGAENLILPLQISACLSAWGE
jgi:hypothetical protein